MRAKFEMNVIIKLQFSYLFHLENNWGQMFLKSSLHEVLALFVKIQHNWKYTEITLADTSEIDIFINGDGQKVEIRMSLL